MLKLVTKITNNFKKLIFNKSDYLSARISNYQDVNKYLFMRQAKITMLTVKHLLQTIIKFHKLN